MDLRIIKKILRTAIPILLPALIFAQTPSAKQPATIYSPKSGGTVNSGVDTIIQLVKGGMSESLVIKTIQREGKAYALSTPDMLKLQKAGVSEKVIEVMMDPMAGASALPSTTAAQPTASSMPAAYSSAPVAPTLAAVETPASLPADLPNASGPRKRRLAIQPFDYSAVKNWVTFWFKNDVNIGQGIRAMLQARMHQSKTITLLERNNMDNILKEQDFNASGRVNQGTKAKIGRISGADCILFGDIVIFGRDDTTKRKGLGAALGGLAGGLATFNKEEKAVVGITLRLVDAETGEVVESAEARGESSRKSKDWGALLGGKGSGAGVGSEMTSSNFENTIIGEATSDAVNKVLSFLESKIPQLPLKARAIEGRVANISANGIYLTVGADDGVLPGDRFDILQIQNEVIDPATKQVLDVDAVKVGEMVAQNVREKVASGPYGGQPLSPTYAKGYTARLTSK